MVVKKNLTVDELVGSLPPEKEFSEAKKEPAKTDSASPQNNFDGFVDNRVIPDAGVPTQYMEGILDVSQEGHGYLRPNFSPSEKDVYISSSQIRRFYLRPGD
ncbi:hypothetical protein MUP35_01065, partial [Patescibacteria group bacterium]|nr:hypothetical protein [Patescibacteria group bacterium]